MNAKDAIIPVTVTILTEEDLTSIANVIDQRLTAFELRMDQRFVDHMTEIESYYGQRDRELQQQVSTNRDSINAIDRKLDEVLRILNGDKGNDTK